MALVAQRKIEIPFGQGDEVLELEVSNLPDPTETMGILQEQESKINLWIQLALEYYRQGKEDALELLLTTCLNKWTQAAVKRHSHVYPDGDKDRIKALDLLAIYYVRKGYLEKNRDKGREFFVKAAQKFTEVDKSEFISMSKDGSEYQFHLLGRAYCCLIEGRNDQADAHFNFVLQQQQQLQQPENVPSLLGRARIEFNKKETSGKRNALNLYRRALQICPNCPADVRIGLAICFYKLNMTEKAEAAFLRALSLNRQSVGALTGLALIELNKKTGISIKRGIEYLSRAYKINPNEPMVLILLADHFFYANELDKVIKLANKAMDNTENESIQAQACYQLARAYHRKKDFDSTFEYYYKATQFGGPQFFLAFYGLGQMYIHRKEFDSAIQAFEAVLKTNPENLETLKVLASLYATSSSNTKHELAKTYLKKITEKRPDDVDAWIELASLTEQNDAPVATNAYKNAISLLKAQKKPILPELYNNLAALLTSVKSLDEASKCYQKALKRCKKYMDQNEEHYGIIIWTIQYNIGRLQEEQHLLPQAAETYKNIILKHPTYSDCYFRLGCMERDRGDIYEASELFKETFKPDVENTEYWTLVANLHLSKMELKLCQRKMEYILNENKTNPDLYAMVSVGNVWLLYHYMNPRDREKSRSRALTYYRHALKYDPKNIYAASGIGCILATNKMYSEARDVFSQVREATADFPDIWINLAHIYVEQHQYVAAVQMYESCLKNFYNNSNSEIILYIARALFKSNKLIECKKALLRARCVNPSELVIVFNLAKVLKTLARQVFEDRKSTYQAVVTAEYELKLAKSYFTYYTENKDKNHGDLDRTIIDSASIESEESDCTALLVQLDRSIKTDAEQRDREEQTRRMAYEEQLAKELARKAEEEQHRIEGEKIKREELEAKRREILKKQEEAKQKMSHDDTGGIVHDDGSDDGEPRQKRKKKASSSKESSRKKERLDRDDRSAEGGTSSGSKKFKSKAILSSDESDSSDDEVA